MARFKKNKYTKWYYGIVTAAKERCHPSGYSEMHHVVPISLGGSRSKENEVCLTAREHFICHFLLTRMVSGKAKKKMTYAFHMMKSNPRGNGNRYQSRLFEMTRSELAEATSGKNSPTYGLRMCGKENHFYGKQHTKKTKELIRAKLKGKMVGKNNPFYGKKHTEKTKELIRAKQGKAIMVIFEDGKQVQLSNKRSLGTYLGKSRELGAKLNDPRFRYLWDKYNIKEIHEND